MDQKRVPDGWDKDKALAEGVRLNVKQKWDWTPYFIVPRWDGLLDPLDP